MISRHIDIWAILLLLFAFALFTRTSDAALRFVNSGIHIQHRVPVEVHVSPFELNHFGQPDRAHRIAPLHLI
jgi:hypothetical protein